MSVTFPSVGSHRMDVGRDSEKSCFVVVCLCCYNLGRFEHVVGVGLIENQTAVEFECDTCHAHQRVDA